MIRVLGVLLYGLTALAMVTPAGGFVMVVSLLAKVGQLPPKPWTLPMGTAL